MQERYWKESLSIITRDGRLQGSAAASEKLVGAEYQARTKPVAGGGLVFAGLQRCSPSKQRQADAPGGRNVSGARLRESFPWAPSTGTCSLRPSAPASRPP